MINRGYVKELLEKGVRIDGRKTDEYRDLTIEVNTLSQANGLARVKLGDTEVLVGVKFGVSEPYPDSPDQGTLITSADHPPMASKAFEPGPPRAAAIEFARVIDRAVRESGALDFNKLVIREGEKVWSVFVDIFPINDGGNLFDAACIGAVLALSNAYFPEYDEKEDKIDHRKMSKNRLKLEKIPVLCTYGRIGENTILDTNLEEESILDAKFHIGTVDGGAICAMQMSGDGGFTEKEVKKLTSEAIKKGKDLRKLLKKYIK